MRRGGGLIAFLGWERGVGAFLYRAWEWDALGWDR